MLQLYILRKKEFIVKKLNSLISIFDLSMIIEDFLSPHLLVSVLAVILYNRCQHFLAILKR